MKKRNVTELLLEEHSKKQCTKVLRVAIADKEAFDELLRCFLSEDGELSRRAAWALGYAGIERKDWLKPWIGKIIRKIGNKDNHPAVARNGFRIFEEVDVPEKWQAKLLDTAYSYIPDPSQPLGIRAFALTAAERICRIDKDLQRELLMICMELKNDSSPAIQVRIRRIERAFSGSPPR